MCLGVLVRKKACLSQGSGETRNENGEGGEGGWAYGGSMGVGLEPVTRNAEEERPEAYCEGDEGRGGGQLRGRFSGAALD